MSQAVRSAFLGFAAGLLLPGAALAGPPFMTDDPEPTDPGHWEIYAPLVESEGKGSDYEGSAGVEINYGAAPNLQLTVALPVDYAHDESGFHSGPGDVELSAKYRFYHDEDAALSVAFFPGITLPTGGHGRGNPNVTALLPVWAQKDMGPWSLFGGGGYAINPGSGNRDYWTGGGAVTREGSKKLMLGIEADRQGPDTDGGRASTSLGPGAILQLKAPFRLLGSGGPTFVDGSGTAAFHLFMALGLDL